MGEDSFSADHALAGLDVDGAGGGDVEVGAGAEADHTDAFACLDGVPLFFPADDAAGDEAGDLANEDGTAGGAQEPSLVFVTDIDFVVAGIEEFAGGVVGFLDGGSERGTVDVDIEDGEEDADAAKLAEAEARILGFVDADDFTIGGADEGEGIGRGGTLGIAKKEKEAEDEKSGEGGGNPPGEPEGGAEECGGGDEEGSCFT